MSIYCVLCSGEYGYPKTKQIYIGYNNISTIYTGLNNVLYRPFVSKFVMYIDLNKLGLAYTPFSPIWAIHM